MDAFHILHNNDWIDAEYPDPERNAQMRQACLIIEEKYQTFVKEQDALLQSWEAILQALPDDVLFEEERRRTALYAKLTEAPTSVLREELQRRRKLRKLSTWDEFGNAS